MNKEFEKIIKESRKVSLTKEEMSSMSSNIRRAMSLYPAEDNRYTNNAAFPESLKSPFSRLFLGRFLPAAIAVLVVFSAGGVSFAAGKALPGDLLYAIKLNVNENIRALAAFTSESKAELASALAERRLEEAEVLAIAGNLKTDLRQRIEKNFSKQAERAEERIKKFVDSGDLETAAKLSSALEVSLETHDKILAKVDENDGGESVRSSAALGISARKLPEEEISENANEIKALKEIVRSRAKMAESLRENIERKISGSADESALKGQADGRIRAAQNKISETENFVESKKNGLGEGVYAEISSGVAEARGLVEEARREFSAEDYETSIKLSLRAFMLAQELKTAAAFNSNPGFGPELPAIEIRSILNSDGDVSDSDSGSHVAPEDKNERESSSESENGKAGVRGENSLEINLR